VTPLAPLLVVVAAAAASASGGADPGGPAPRSLEERVAGLRARLSGATLPSAAAAEADSTPRVVLVHVNALGEGVRLEKVAYELDGEPVFERTDAQGDLAPRAAAAVYEGPLAPGRHALAVTLECREDGGWLGLAADRRFTLRSMYTFEAHPGERVTLTIQARERASPAAGEPRAEVRYAVESRAAAPRAPKD
jgi:hypothetical protein